MTPRSPPSLQGCASSSSPPTSSGSNPVPSGARRRSSGPGATTCAPSTCRWTPGIPRSSTGPTRWRSRSPCTPRPASPATSPARSTSRCAPSACTRTSARDFATPVDWYAALAGARPVGTARSLRAPRRRRRAAPGRLGAGDARLRAPLPPLPGAGGVRRPRPSRRRGRRARRHHAARRRRRASHHVRRPRLPQRATALASHRGRAARAVPRDHLRLHGEGRARRCGTKRSGPSSPPPAACSWSRRSSRSTTPCSNGSTRATRRPTPPARSGSCATQASRCDPRGCRSRRGPPAPTSSDLLDFVDEHDLVGSVDPVQYSVRLLLPEGSLLLEHPDLAPHVGPWDPERSTYTWSSPDPAVDALQERIAAIVDSDQRPDRALRTCARGRRCSTGRPHTDHDRPPPTHRDLVLLRRAHRPPARAAAPDDGRRAWGLVRRLLLSAPKPRAFRRQR